MKNTLFLLFIFLIIGCKNHTGKSQLRIYVIQGLSGDTMSIINKKDIICIDWQHQSFKLTQNASEKVDKLPLLASSKYFFSVTLDSVEYYRVYVLSKYASHSIPKDSPYIIFNDKPLYSVLNENWFVTRYYRKKENYFYKQVFSKKLYDYFSKVGLLKGFNWKCSGDKKGKKNRLSKENISKNFKLRFRKEYN